MFRKTMYLLCVVVLLSMATKASAVAYYYFGNGGMDQKWSNLANWSGTPAVPPDISSPQSDVYLGYAAAGTATVPVVVDGSQPRASFQWLTIGATSYGAMDVNSGGKSGVSGGIMFVGCNVNIGTSTGYGVVNVDGTGSEAYGEIWNIANVPGKSGTGIVNITNGGQMTIGWWAGTAIGTDGTGTINITNGRLLKWGTDFTIGAGGKIVLYPSGKFDLNADQTAQINGLVAQGRIVTNSNRCSLTVAFNADLNQTEVRTTCTCTTFATGDFNHDCYVDFLDVAAFASQWLTCTDPLNTRCSQ